MNDILILISICLDAKQKGGIQIRTSSRGWFDDCSTLAYSRASFFVRGLTWQYGADAGVYSSAYEYGAVPLSTGIVQCWLVDSSLRFIKKGV